MRLPIRVGVLGFWLILMWACQPGVEPLQPALIRAASLAAYDNATLKTLRSTHDALTYDPAGLAMSIFRLTYRTTLANGTSVQASGTVILPTGSDKALPLLGYQHPTAFSNTDVPSGYDYTKPQFSLPLYFASHGYVVACPDYIGYGETNTLAHPYEDRATLAQATADMMRATREWLQQQAVVWNGQVFLVGFSEGAFASLSAQQLIESSYADELPLAGVSCGAGPYEMSAFFDYITHQPTPSVGVGNYLYVWQTLVYNRLYNLNRPVSYYFKEPYASQISQSPELARTFTVSFHELCTDAFREAVRNPESAFAKALAANDLTHWTTKTPTYLMHGDQDDVIPYFISEDTYRALQQQGAQQVQLITLPQVRHVPSEPLFMRRSLALFEQLKRS